MALCHVIYLFQSFFTQFILSIMARKIILVVFSRLFLLLLSFTSIFGQSPFGNSRVTLDLSSRFSAQINEGSESFIHFVGLDKHNLFSDEKGDWGAYVGQFYIGRKDTDGMQSNWNLTTKKLNIGSI